MALVRNASILHLMAWFGALMFGWLIVPLADMFAETAGRRKVSMTKRGVEEQRKEFRKSCPALFKALIDERDLFMTHVIHMIFELSSRAKFSGAAEPLRVIAVVGAMHVPGITSLFGTPVDREVLKELCR
ncbi:hypothetical protein AAVH_26641 [Aphelenchoides avenae]|nr:hypothetical protein AAVH_26641 [Aphelenchus avenae]